MKCYLNIQPGICSSVAKSFSVRLLWKASTVTCSPFLFSSSTVIEIADLHEIHMVIEESSMLSNFTERGFLMGSHTVGNFSVQQCYATELVPIHYCKKILKVTRIHLNLFTSTWKIHLRLVTEIIFLYWDYTLCKSIVFSTYFQFLSCCWDSQVGHSYQSSSVKLEGSCLILQTVASTQRNASYVNQRRLFWNDMWFVQYQWNKQTV